MTDPALQAEITSRAQAGEPRTLTLADEQSLAGRFGISRLAVQQAAVAAEVLPYRYARNFGTLGFAGQAKLLAASVAVIGAGGLGGYIVEGLARAGVGRLLVADGDVFEEHNLNRQLLASEETLAVNKAVSASTRVASINGAVQVEALPVMLDDENGPRLLRGCTAVVDALDSLPARFMLERVARQLGIPMVHGAIAGFIAQVTTIFPEDQGLRLIYGSGAVPQHGVESLYGNPSGTPMFCAGLQVQETIKLLAGLGEPLRNRLLTIDSEYGIAQVLRLAD